MNTELELAKPPVDIEKLDTAKPLAVIFQPYQTTLEKWEAKAASLVVTDLSQKTEMAQARLARLELKEARVALDKTRKGLVEGLKERTSKIDSTARIIREKLEDLEGKLLASEQFADRHAAKVKAELKVARETELSAAMDGPAIFMTDLSDLSESDYASALADAKLLRETKLAAFAKAEAERKAKEEADRLERERIVAENARLKAEATETARLAEIERQRVEAERASERAVARAAQAEALAQAKAETDRLAAIALEERKKIEAKAKAAATETARLNAELAAKAKIEAAELARVEMERKLAEQAARKAAAAPDKAKLIAFASFVCTLELPKFVNATLQSQVDSRVQSHMEELAKWLVIKADAL